jgi:6-phosphogluconolactonase
VELKVFSDLHELSAYAAARFADTAKRIVQERGRFTACLSGGSTPQLTYSLLAQPPYSEEVPWQDVHLFWGDERCVPLSSPDNHFNMTTELLLSKVDIPPKNVHRMRGEAEDPFVAAETYEQEITTFFCLSPGGLPRFDLVFLGMGDDGHTASLYPGSQGLTVMDKIVVAHYVAQRKGFRLTLTLPVLNNAQDVVFLAVGESKAPALRAILRKGPDETEVPAYRVNPVDGTVTWLVDRAAASMLEG